MLSNLANYAGLVLRYSANYADLISFLSAFSAIVVPIFGFCTAGRLWGKRRWAMVLHCILTIALAVNAVVFAFVAANNYSEFRASLAFLSIVSLVWALVVAIVWIIKKDNPGFVVK